MFSMWLYDSEMIFRQHSMRRLKARITFCISTVSWHQPTKIAECLARQVETLLQQQV